MTPRTEERKLKELHEKVWGQEEPRQGYGFLEQNLTGRHFRCSCWVTDPFVSASDSPTWETGSPSLGPTSQLGRVCVGRGG